VRNAGLTHERAAFKLHWLLARALTLGLSGVTLKDESDRALEAGVAAPALPHSTAD
jgi:ethanolamine ammonia-lyase small subunit